jgi:hypothetical protein
MSYSFLHFDLKEIEKDERREGTRLQRWFDRRMAADDFCDGTKFVVSRPHLPMFISAFLY